MRVQIPMLEFENPDNNVCDILLHHGIDPVRNFTSIYHPDTGLVEVTQEQPTTFQQSYYSPEH